jgi:hypothetical protein
MAASVPLVLGLLVYTLLLIAFVATVFASNRARSVVTPILLFGLFEIISVWPATLIAAGSGSSETGAYPVLVAALAFGVCLLGFGLTMAARKYSSDEPEQFRGRPLEHPYPESVYLLATALVACILAGLGLYLYQGWPPLVGGLFALGQGSDGLASAINIVAAGRETATKGQYLGQAYRGQGVILELTQDGWPYLVTIASAMFLVTRKRHWLAVAVALFVLMLFFIAGSGQRWQILAGLICVAASLSLVARPRTRWVVALAGVLLLIYSGMSVLNSTYEGFDQSADPVASFISLGASRIALANGMHDVDSINLVHAGSLDWGMGSIHLQKFMTSIPGLGKDQLPFSAKLAFLLDPSRPTTDTTYASSTYLGWLYVDFGLAGTLVVFFLMGITLALAQEWLFRVRGKDVLDIAARGLAIFYMGELALDGPATAGASLVIVCVLYLGLRASTALLNAPLGRAASRPVAIIRAGVVG